jgi:hypothetical protein
MTVKPIESPEQQRGQMFAGYIVAIFLLAGLIVLAANGLRRSRADSQSRIYRELALNVARSGFEDGLSYFRRQPDGVYLAAYPNDAPTSQNWVTPWPQWPDAAFLPQGKDTDNFNLIGQNSPLTATAGAILRTVPLNSYSNTATSVELKGSRLWGRYVLRRQNARNWSPGANTFAAFTDPEAVHDLTHIRGDNVPGSGNYWSIFSRAYVFAYPDALTISAAHEGNCLLSPPLRFYNGRRLLLATASVYGELSRVNFNQPSAALFVSALNKVTVNNNTLLNGSGGYAIVRQTGDSTSLGGACGACVNGSNGTVAKAPSVAFCFPGQDKSHLRATASNIDATKVGGINVFPRTDDVNYADEVSRTSFYYITTSASTPTIIFANGDTRVMSGVGLIIIDGNLTIQNKNNSTWTGVVFVDGNVDIRGPAEIGGTLIATGTVSLGNASDNFKATLEYNSDAVDTVQSFLQNFRVVTNSVVTSQR